MAGMYDSEVVALPVVGSATLVGRVCWWVWRRHGEPRVVRPAPPIFYMFVQQGPTSQCLGSALPIRTRDQGLLGHWVKGARDQSNDLPIDLIFCLFFFLISSLIIDLCIEHASLSRSIAHAFNIHNTRLYSKTDLLSFWAL